MATYEIAHLQIFHDSQRKILNWLFPHFIANLHFKKYSLKLCPQHMKEKNHYWCRVLFLGIILSSLWNRNGFKVWQNCFGDGICILLIFHTVINYFVPALTAWAHLVFLICLHPTAPLPSTVNILNFSGVWVPSWWSHMGLSSVLAPDPLLESALGSRDSTQLHALNLGPGPFCLQGASEGCLFGVTFTL